MTVEIRDQTKAKAMKPKKKEEGLTRGIIDIAVSLARLEIRQRGRAPRRVRHHTQAAVHHALLEQLAERPPHRLHKRDIQRLVIIIKVDPAAHALDGGAPLGRVAHDDLPALVVVLVDAHREHVVLPRDAQSLVDLVLDGQPVRVPPEPPCNVVPADVRVPGDDVLIGA